MVTVTPFDERGRINHEGLDSHLEFLLERGVKVIVPCGNTSEFYSLTREEVKEATRRSGASANRVFRSPRPTGSV